MGSTTQTLFLLNNSLLPGNVLSENGISPVALAIDTGTGYVYVADMLSSTVTVIDPTTGHLVASIPVQSTPDALAYDGTDGKVFVANYAADTVSVINDTLNSVIDTFNVGTWPAAAVYDPLNGFLYVANQYSEGNISVIDAATDTVVDWIMIGTDSYPNGLAFDPVNGCIYVADWGWADLTVIDGSTNTIVDTIGTPWYPYAIAYDAYDNYVVSTLNGDNRLYVVDATTGNYVDSPLIVGSGPEGVACDPMNGYCYVANFNDYNVTVLNVSSMSEVGSIWGGGVGPRAVAYDADNGEIYVANENSNNLSVISGTSAVGSIALGASPTSILYDPVDHYVVVTDAQSDNVSGIVDTINRSIGSLPVGDVPAAMAYDPGSDFVYVANSNSNTVTVIDAYHGDIVGEIPVGDQPVALALDPDNGYLYVANNASNNVTVIDTSIETVVDDISVGLSPDAIAFDPDNGYLYVADYFSSNLTVVAGSNDTVVGSVSVYYYPTAIAFDPESHSLYVTSPYYDTVAMVNDTYNVVIATVSVGADPDAIAYDAAAGEMLVSNRLTNNVSVIDAATNVGLGSFAVGYHPDGLVWDPWDGAVYVANRLGGSISIVNLNATYDVTFAETGLPAGAVWNVNFYEPLWDLSPYTIASSITFVGVPNGTYLFTLPNVTEAGREYAPSPNLGFAYVTGANVTVNITFTAPPLYLLEFNATGLPNGTHWEVGVCDVWDYSLCWTYNDSFNSTVSFYVKSGLYSFNVPTTNTSTALYLPNESYGYVLVNGTNASVNITFSEEPYYFLTFSETGLPNGSAWGVGIYNSTLGWLYYGSTNSSFVVPLPNGTYYFYSYDEWSNGRYYLPSPAWGYPTINGTNLTVEIDYGFTYGVVIEETGLPFGTYWYDELYTPTGIQYNSSYENWTEFYVPNGSYSFLLPSLWTGAGGWYVASPALGDILVDGANVTVNITYSFQPSYEILFNETGLPSGTYWFANINDSGIISLYNSSTLSEIGFWVPNGTYYFWIDWAVSAGGQTFIPSPEDAYVNVSGGNVTVNVTYSPTYTVTFVETGLPNGTLWTVVWDGGFVYSSTNETISLISLNGTFSYLVEGVPGYSVSPPAGDIVVDGSFILIDLLYAVPSIIVTPGQGPVGANVTVSGSGFTFASNVSLKFDGIAILASSCVGGNLTVDASGNFGCAFVVPAGTSGVDVTVVDYSGTSEAAHFWVTTPHLTFYPGQGPVGAEVTVTGTGFSVYAPLASLTLNGTPITSCVSGSLTTGSPYPGAFECSFLVPSVASLVRVPLTATDVGGASASVMFWVTTPHISVYTGQGPVGALVTVSGTGFSVYAPLASVTLNGVPITSCVSGSMTTGSPYPGAFSCTFTVPSLTPGSHVSLVVTDVGGTVTSATFWVTSPSLSVYPGQGPVGATVTVTGTGFSVYSALRSLTLDGVPITACSSGSLTTGSPYPGAFRCTFVVPSVPSGTRLPLLASDLGGSSASFALWVTTPMLVITPGHGAVGTTVTITGYGFSVYASLSSLVFDGIPITSCVSGSLTTGSPYPGAFSCTILVPTGTSGTNVVANDIGGATATAKFTVTV